MATITILVISWVLRAFAQSPHSIPGFQYTGCSSIDLSCFGDPIVFPDGCVTPEACQKACEGFQFAALLNEQCRCGNDSTAITSQDESKCDHACQNNPLLGYCGSSCPEENPGTANVYGKEPPLEQYTSTPNPATTDASASVSSATPVSSQLVTPTGPAPEPQSQSTALPVSQSASTQTSEPCPPAQPSEYQTADGQAPEPQTYVTSIADAVQATSSGSSSSAPAIPQYESTMATKAAPSNKPHESPVPSQVPGSDSAPICLPSFSSLGGLALIAVMMM